MNNEDESKKVGAEVLTAMPGAEPSPNFSAKPNNLPPFVAADKPGSATTGTEITGDGCINRAGVSKRLLNMFEHDPDEVILAEITKHPIGIVGIWTVTIFIITAIWAAVIILNHYADNIIQNLNSFNAQNLSTAAILIGVALTALTVLFGYISFFLYINNRIILTSEKLVQIRYFSLFNHKVSSLSIGDVQDVTARQKGILPILFGFGKISIETAGEQDNYEFPLATNATENSKLIVQAHEENLHRYGN